MSKRDHAIIIVGILVVICFAAIVFEPVILPMISKPTPTATQPVSSPPRRYQPEIIPPPTYTPDAARTVTIAPTNALAPAFTPTFTPTSTPINGPLPDLTVTGISDPICIPDHIGTIFQFNIIVRNIGRAPTRAFGPFDVGVNLILGQTYYGLDEWGTKFNGVVGASNLEISNLDPDRDVTLTLVLDLKGNTTFGIEAIANSGVNTIPDADGTNNTLIKYFSKYCY